MSSNDPSKLITGIRDFYVVEGRPECRLPVFLFPHGEVSFSTMRFKVPVLLNDPAAYQDYCEDAGFESRTIEDCLLLDGKPLVVFKDRPKLVSVWPT